MTARAALETFWRDDALKKAVERKAELAKSRFMQMIEKYPDLGLSHRGLGLIQGLVFPDGELASSVSHHAFERGVIIETAGAGGEVVKLLPSLTIDDEALAQGMDIVEESLDAVWNESKRGERAPSVHA